MRRRLKVSKGSRLITEAELQNTIIQAARAYGWLVYHTHDSRRSSPGFPDLVLVHPARRRLIFAELKVGRYKISADQKQWLDALLQVENAEVHLWRETDIDVAISLLAVTRQERERPPLFDGAADA